MRRAATVLLALLIGLTTSTSTRWFPAVPAFAQDAPMSPRLGDVILDDPLTESGPFPTASCPTGRDVADFVPDGYRVKVTGRCFEREPNPGMRPIADGLTVTDGEVSVEAQVVEGVARARISLSVRLQANGDAYLLLLEPARGRAELRKGIGGSPITLAERTDLAPRSTGTWTRLSLRLAGESLWGFVDDEVAVAAVDSTFDSGEVGVAVARDGGSDDTEPVTVVWRTLRVTALAAGDVARVPTYSAPAPGTRAGTFVPGVGTPPSTVRIVHSESLAEAGALRPGACPTGRGGASTVNEGLLLTARGRCLVTAPSVLVSPPVTGLTIRDGEMRVDFKVLNGLERVVIDLVFRVQADGISSGYTFGILPGVGQAAILKSSPGQVPDILAQRSDLGSLLRRDGWNTLAARVLGSRLWLLVNDLAMLTVEDSAFDAGTAMVAIERWGSPDDDVEVAVVFRDLRISTVEGSPEDRAPSYQPSSGSTRFELRARLP